jgi:3D (Asp-Asp-Asp) domain-containing protein
MKNVVLSLFTVCLLASCNTINVVNKPKNVVEKVRTTAYTHSEKDHIRYKKKTAIGTTLVQNKSAAADWSVFPVGTVLEINKTKYQIDDYGSALVKPKGVVPTVDIYQPSKYAMNRWGVKNFENVKVIKWGDYQESLDILKYRLKYAHCRTMYSRIQEKM